MRLKDFSDSVASFLVHHFRFGHGELTPRQMVCRSYRVQLQVLRLCEASGVTWQPHGERIRAGEQ